ncbi:MAG: site-2 protease family protein [Clostridia bacterium]|nr:site-2 protease family protein [Clostridia bacterium]
MGISTVMLMFSQNPMQALLYILISFLAMCVAISFHEWAHAFVAYKLGDPTAKNMGRMSIDPFRHMDWMGAVVFLLFGFGWAKPVVVNSRNLKHYRRDDILISLAGPVMNLLLAFVFTGVAMLVPMPNQWIALTVMYLISMNLNFALFNVLPVPPLDGFHVVTSLFVRKNYAVVDFLQKYGYFLLILLVFSGALDVVLGWAATGLYDLFRGFYGLFI